MNLQRLALLAMAAVIPALASPKEMQQSNAPEFGAASIKLNSGSDHRVRIQMSPGGRLSITAATLKELIRNAYGIEDFQIVGGPAWLSADRWDLQAKAEENLSQKQMYPMLQTLLTNKFQLKFHKQSRTGPIYNLVIARNGPKLKETNYGANGAAPASHGDSHQSHGESSHASGRGMTMAQFAQMLAENLGRPVIDQTGLKGNYDINLSWAPDPGQRPAYSDHVSPEREREPSTQQDLGSPSIFAAIQELGLKLKSAKGSVDMVVIDSVQKPPIQ